jgi:hypothetical protein
MLRIARNDKPSPDRTRFRLAATNGIGDREGAFMNRLIGAATMLVIVAPAYAADVATCTLSADKKTVTVSATNPYSKAMACEVNCDMAIPNGIATVVCVKPVPVGARDFVMCTETATEGHLYTRVKGASLNCPDPSAPPPGSKAEADGKDDDDDDAKAEALMQKMQKQAQEFLGRQKPK